MNRGIEQNRCYHLVSRLAHRAFFLDDEEKDRAVVPMRRENDRHVFNHLATLRPDPDAADKRAEAARLTREAMRLLDAAIRARPGDWYWFNTRWILEPV
jgi:lauroyl/myristoyl acyltransferase